MRIAIISSSYPVDPHDSRNAGVFVRDFALRMARRGVEVTVLTPQRVRQADPGIEVIPFRRTTPEASLTHLGARHPVDLGRMGLLMLAGIWTVVGTSRRRQFDAILAMWAIPSGAFALANRFLFGTPYVVWALGSDIWRAGDYPAGRWMLRRVLRGARSLYADGTGLATEVERIAGSPCTFLASSRDLPAPSEIPELERSLRHFLCVARFHPNKGVDVLVEAVARLPVSRRSGMRFHVFGGGPHETLLRSLIRQRGLEGVVTIGSYLSPGQLAGYLRAVDWMIIPSRIESVPLILSDAAQAGRCVIVSDVGDMGELVRRHQAGIVVPPEAPDDLARAILDAEARVGGCAGARDLARELGLDRSVERFLTEVAQGR